MTLIEAINNIDSLKPNTYTQYDKIKWLSMLDNMIKLQVIDTHEPELITITVTDPDTGEEHEEEVEKYYDFVGYTDDTPVDTELIASVPYDDMYVAWLESKIDYSNAEYTRYNNSITRFNDIYNDYSKYYNRTHKPLGTQIKYY